MVPTVEEPPTMVPTIPPNTRAEEADFLPLKSFPFCFLEDSALTDNMRNRIRIRPKYIISGEVSPLSLHQLERKDNLISETFINPYRRA